MTFGIIDASDIRVDDTFVMVGGRIFDEQGHVDKSDKLIKYLPESETFIELPGKMKTRRYLTAAIVVERSIFPPCA